MSSHPAVSVIIPAYNTEPWIGTALDSVLSQTWRDFECIVVDDGSTDNTADVVRRFSDSRVRLLQQANAGANAARNHALGAARGAYVTCLDSDDYWDRTFLEKMLAALESEPNADFAFCASLRFMDGTNAIKPEAWTGLFSTGNIWWDVLCGACIPTGTWLAKSEALNGSKPFDPSLLIGGDRDFLLFLFEHIYYQRGRTALPVAETLHFYRQRAGSLVRQSREALRREWGMMGKHIRRSSVPEAVRVRAFSNLAFKMSVIAAFGARDIPLALRWYWKAFWLEPGNGNLWRLPLRKLLCGLRRVEYLRPAILSIALGADFGGSPDPLFQLLMACI